MNDSVKRFTRAEIKECLAALQEQHHHLFKRMYSPGDLKKPIDQVVDDMPDDRLEWALTQCQRTLHNLKES